MILSHFYLPSILKTHFSKILLHDDSFLLVYDAALVDNKLLTFERNAMSSSSSWFKMYSFFLDILTFEDGEATLS
jgi:hypothetical protein